MLVLAAATVVILVWGTWLAHARRGPSWVRWIAPSVVASTVITCAISWWQLRAAMGAVTLEEAGKKATRLAEGISSALNAVAIGMGIAIVAVLVLAYATLRSRRAS